MVSDAVFMALEMIIDPRGMAARGAKGTMPRARRTPRVPAVATPTDARAMPVGAGYVLAPGPRT